MLESMGMSGPKRLRSCTKSKGSLRPQGGKAAANKFDVGIALGLEKGTVDPLFFVGPLGGRLVKSSCLAKGQKSRRQRH